MRDDCDRASRGDTHHYSVVLLNYYQVDVLFTVHWVHIKKINCPFTPSYCCPLNGCCWVTSGDSYIVHIILCMCFLCCVCYMLCVPCMFVRQCVLCDQEHTLSPLR